MFGHMSYVLPLLIQLSFASPDPLPLCFASQCAKGVIPLIDSDVNVWSTPVPSPLPLPLGYRFSKRQEHVLFLPLLRE